MEVEKTLSDGTILKYKAGVSTAFQDFKGSNLAASLDPNGITTVQAGAIDNVTNAAIVDALGKIADVLDKLAPLLLAP